MTFDANTLYALLPGWTRVNDAAQGGPLQDLMSVIADQMAVLEEDLAQSYDNLFIETCAPWVVPYIGDLLQTTPLIDASRIADTGTVASLCRDLTGPTWQPEIGLRDRADVAKTIYYRRRKTTLPMLEQLAGDVTGWAAHVREFFATLAWSQAARNHVRPASFYASDLRSVPDIDRIDGPFDTAPRVVDVRPPGQTHGWHNIPNVGIYLWRLASTPLDQVPARPQPSAGTYCFSVSPLGQDAPLFTRYRASIDATIPSAEPLLPGPIRPAAFYDDLLAYHAAGGTAGFTQYYGHFGTAPIGTLPQADGASLFVVIDGTPIPPEQLQTMNLSSWHQPPGNTVGIDVALGRIALGPALASAKTVAVSAFSGFPAALGGGGYDRQAFLVPRAAESRVVTVSQTPGAGNVTSLAAAIAAVGASKQALISILDNATYAETLTVTLAAGQSLAIEAADQFRPHLQLTAPLTVTGPADATLTLSGLLIEGAVTVQGTLGRLRVLHSTLVPGLAIGTGGVAASQSPSVTALGTASLDLEFVFSVTGPLDIADVEGGRIWLLNSILDGAGGVAIGAAGTPPTNGPALWIERSSVLGPCYVHQIDSATEALFAGQVTTLHRQTGCMRFSYAPLGSTTPRRYRCQPDLAIANQIALQPQGGANLTQAQTQAIATQVASWLLPAFTDTRYGQPAYAQLARRCPRQIAQGAEDGSEMGAYCHLKQAQRLSNLRLRLQEYLPFGREPAIVLVT